MDKPKAEIEFKRKITDRGTCKLHVFLHHQYSVMFSGTMFSISLVPRPPYQAFVAVQKQGTKTGCGSLGTRLLRSSMVELVSRKKENRQTVVGPAVQIIEI